jgi:hypothetical protein
MKEKNVGEEVDRILTDNDPVLKAVGVGNNKPTRYRMKKTKLVGKLNLVIALFVVGALIVSGALIVYYSVYTSSMDGDIDLEGVSSLLLFDGIPMTTETFTIPMDISIMVAGEEATSDHSVESLPGNGDWDVGFDCVALREILGIEPYDPNANFFGFTFDVFEDGTCNSILDELTYVKCGAGPVPIDFYYALDEMFMHVGSPLPFTLDVLISEHENLPPVCGLDEATIPVGSYCDVFVLDNDYDPENVGVPNLLITDFNPEMAYGIGVSLEGVFPSQYLNVYVGSLASGEMAVFTYTVEDPEGLEGIGTVEINAS